jgi:hypothetical protein
MKMLTYKYNQDALNIEETINGEDKEFTILIKEDEPYLERMKQMQKFFDSDNIYTDVMFYVYENHRYQIIVRQDHYVNFVLVLMRHQLLVSVQWTE